ncbi:ABC transporter permease [Heliophilum fasciatum]|uniref:NitT/TauT family transport system permease protein n=1 Tax=Heliophilum fasciatum TaxID=35700 RepID=A0A4R2S135_9FIRM|nr:ABC transporter permease [Heliophilum fasciatum]MCW2277698.1 NitT/TauT family transport system permease protein [Heliophilum fasciatum]TCP65045.1 NitT/TauT family transport system permease protein [Heliophilum fasciatum]
MGVLLKKEIGAQELAMAKKSSSQLSVQKKIRSWVKQGFANSAAIIVFLLLWEIAPRVGWVEQTFIAPPSVALATIGKWLVKGTLIKHVGVSLSRALLGFILAMMVGIPLGFLLGGWYRTFERIVTPVLRLMGEVNPFALFPVFILLFGIGEVSKISMIFWVCLWPILFNTVTGVKNVDPLLIKSAHSMGVRQNALFFKVILPSAAPNIFHGVKMSSGLAFFMLIAAEMIGASSGLGWLVWNAQNNYQIPDLFGATMVISVLGLSINQLFAWAERRLLAWKQSTTAW